MYRRDYQERDLLVQILTDHYGPKMFLVRGAKKRGFKLTSAILPFSQAHYIGQINPQGLSYLTTTKELTRWPAISADLVLQAYSAYLLSLVAAAFPENQALGQYYDLCLSALTRMNAGIDPQLVTNIVELKLLTCFGVAPQLNGCVICQRRDLPLDYSEKYGGLLCQNHWSKDAYRLHAQPKAIALMQRLNQLKPDQLGQTKLKMRTKRELQRVLDHIYQDQVGLQLKSKRFLTQLISQDSPFAKLKADPKNKIDKHKSDQ